MSTDSLDLRDLKRRMQGAVSVLRSELAGLRSGRAAPSLLEPIQVEAYGAHMPLNQLGTVSAPEPRMLSVQVWDQGLVGAVDKAIRDANLGLNPIVEGSLLRVPIPELNAERRQELVKVAHKYSEQARIAIRHVRRDGMDTLKTLEKDGAIGQDDSHAQADEVQKLTDEHIKDVDDMLAVKEQEITQV